MFRVCLVGRNRTCRELKDGFLGRDGTGREFRVNLRGRVRVNKFQG